MWERWEQITSLPFLSILLHCVKKEKKEILEPCSCPYVRMLGTKTVELWAHQDQCLSFHMAVPPESRGITAERMQCFTLETACHQCQSLWTLNFLWAAMLCQWVWGRSFGYVSFVCVDTSVCIEHWLGEPMANITALEQCFCSQAAWQKWRLVQALVYWSQVINFSPIKTPTGMMEKVGSLTFLTQASCGTLQCVGWWFVQSPAAENVQEWNPFLTRWLFCLGNKKDLLGESVLNF